MAKLDYAKGEGYGLSYSRLSTLHSCPRLFELEHVLGLSKRTNSVTFAYGHVVGAGIQAYFQEHSFERAVAICASFWDMADFWEEGTPRELRAKKNFWTAIEAVQKFYTLMENPHSSLARTLQGYKLAGFTNHNGEQTDGVELTFHVNITDTPYVYEGHMDVVLVHEERKEYLVLEMKTTSFANVAAAQYQNSSQALSYSVVLDVIAGDFNANSSYHVLYLVYSTNKQEFTTFKFPKSVLQRTNWLVSLKCDVAQIEMYRDLDMPYPTNGASCFNFFRDCNWLDRCTLMNETLEQFKPSSDEEIFKEMEKPDFVFEFDDLVERQQQLLADRISLRPIEGSGSQEISIDELLGT